MLSVKRSKIGLGLYSTRQVKPGRLICQIRGTKLHYSTLLKVGGKCQDNAFRLSSSYYLSPQGEYGDYLNHSCRPNVRVVKKAGKLFLFAIQLVEKGSELLLDYSTILARDDCWKMTCKCRAPGCRGKIVSFSKLPKPVLQSYLNSGLIPSYILKAR